MFTYIKGEERETEGERETERDNDINTCSVQSKCAFLPHRTIGFTDLDPSDFMLLLIDIIEL